MLRLNILRVHINNAENMTIAHRQALSNFNIKFLDTFMLWIVRLDSQLFEHIAQGFEIEKFRRPFTQDKC